MLAGSLGLSGCSDPFDYVWVRTWDTEQDPSMYPERSDENLAVGWLSERPSFGISFSGGGTRAATATLGELRALDSLGWIDKAQYIATNSGGAWTSVPYTYLPDSLDERRFLGQYVPPAAITDAILEQEDDELSMASAIYHAKILDLRDLKRVGALWRGDESYSNLVNRIFLRPFGLHERERFFTLDENSRASILEGNAEFSRDDFYVVERQRPFLILVGTMLERATSDAPDERHLFEVTPLYAGARREVLSSDEDNESPVTYGGGYVEPFGYDSYAPESPQVDGRWMVRLKGKPELGDLPSNTRYRFTLADAIGMSSAAPAVTMAGMNLGNTIFADFRHWGIGREGSSSNPESGADARELPHGDGGDIDNLALLPLLARQVQNILVFVNTGTPFRPSHYGGEPVSATRIGGEPVSPEHIGGFAEHSHMVDDVISLFTSIGDLQYNTVFDNGTEELGKLATAFRERQERGEPLVHCQTYRVMDNPRQSIAAYQPNICWVYLERAADWVEQISEPGELTEELRSGTGKFENFPHYRTFGEQGPLFIDLDQERVHAMSNLTAWTAFESAEYVARSLAGAGLETPGR